MVLPMRIGSAYGNIPSAISIAPIMMALVTGAHSPTLPPSKLQSGGPNGSALLSALKHIPNWIPSTV